MPKVIVEQPKFFDTSELTLKRHARVRLPPPIPVVDWICPANPPPGLTEAVVIGFDTETKDLGLDVTGPGWGRGEGHIVGVSLSAKDRLGNRGAWYFPLRHEIESHLNIASEPFFKWLKPVMATPHIPKVGANTTYDYGWLGEENVKVEGELHDVQFAEALLDNEALVALEVLGQKYLNRGKSSELMYAWQRQAYPHTPETKRRKDIYRTPPQLVGLYAEQDAIMPIDIFERQWPLLQKEELDYVYRLECDLIPLMVAMRREGISVDVDQAEKLLVELEAETRIMYRRVFTEYGVNLGSTASGEVSRLFATVGIDTPRTKAGNPSVEKEWLAALEHPLGELIGDIREHEKICGTFIKAYILEKNVNSKLFPQFHQLHGDANGTKVGRFASSHPNLQNIPSRTKLGKRVRHCVVPDAGHSHFRKHDYSQIHYRLLAHFATDDGDGSAENLRESYRNDPNMDYHNNVYMNVAPLLNWDTTDDTLNKFRRRPIKNVNFGLLYGQSVNALLYKTATYFGSAFTNAEGEAFFDAYFKGAPYVRSTMKMIGGEVQTYGYVKTLLGRRIRFHEWEPHRWAKDAHKYYLEYDDAIREWGPGIKRAFEYRGVNYKFQGSEPDIMKHGMRDLLRSGVFDYTGVPRITVHDELDFSVRDKSPEMDEAFRFIQHTMQTTVKLNVPIKVDASIGSNWGLAD